jgi:hypothetical protein
MCPLKPMLLALSTVALCACTTLPPPVTCPNPPEMLMQPPQELRSLPSPEAVVANYQTCHENAEQLRALQAWVREMKARR